MKNVRLFNRLASLKLKSEEQDIRPSVAQIVDELEPQGLYEFLQEESFRNQVTLDYVIRSFLSTCEDYEPENQAVHASVISEIKNRIFW